MAVVVERDGRAGSAASVDTAPYGPGADLRSAGEVPAEWVLRATTGGPEGLPGQWVDAGLTAWAREANRAAWQHARWLLATSRACAGTTERVVDRPRSGKTVAASLGWSEAYAGHRIEFARQVLERLPALGEAMREGVLEERKASVFTATLEDLDDAQARVVVERLLSAAPTLAYGRLRTRVEQTAQAVDPAWAATRRAAVVARRRVGFRVAPSGGAELCGLDLPEEDAQDAHDRIVALGREVARRLRAAGEGAPTGPVESEVMLTLTGPAGAGLTDPEVVDHVVGRFTDPGPSDSGPSDSGPSDSGPSDSGPSDSGPSDSGPSDSGPSDPGPSDPGSSMADGEPGTGPHGASAVAFVPRVVVRVGLGTVLGLDERPGELPGRGVVTAAIARRMAWSRTDGSWRLLLHDPAGTLEHVLLVRPPRCGSPPVQRRRRAQVVEVTAYTSAVDTWHDQLLASRSGGPHAGPPIRIAEGSRDRVLPGDAVAVLVHARRALGAARSRSDTEHPALSTAEADRRFPGAALRAWVQARDRTCRAPGCAADAVGCDVDHTVDWLHGGRTTAGGLGALCRRDHLLKHDPAAGWDVVQTVPGEFTWTAPTGRVHVVRAEPHDPLPDPVAPADGRLASTPLEALEPPPRSPPPGRPRRNRHGYVTDAARATSARLARRTRVGDPDEPPPF